MSFASLVMRRATFNIIKNQIVIVLLVAILLFMLYDLPVFLAGLYGGFIAVSATLISSWRIYRSAQIAPIEKQQAYIELYMGAFQKYIAVIILFAFGLGFLQLNPLATIVSFAMGQIAYLFISIDTNIE